MTCVDMRPDAPERVLTVPPSSGRWWRWLAAATLTAPGGSVAYHLLAIADQDPAPPAPCASMPQAA